jgi:hypothetical protein
MDANGSITGTGMININSVAVSGNYAYVGKSNDATACDPDTAGQAIGCEFMVFDITDPESPTYAAGRDVDGSEDGEGVTLVNITSVAVSGDYAYVGSWLNGTACSQTAGLAEGCELKAYDISTPTDPTYVEGRNSDGSEDGTVGGNINAVAASGNYAYAGKSGSATDCASPPSSGVGCEFMMFNAGSSAPLTIGGSFSNSDTFVHNDGTVVLDGTSPVNLNSGCADVSTCTDEDFYDLEINKTSGTDANDNVTLLTNGIRVTNLLTITDGELVQGALDVQAEGTSAVDIAADGKWNNISTGDLTLGGTFVNAGTAIFNTGNNAQCTDVNDDIVIASTDSGVRTWSGAGAYTMHNVRVTDMSDGAITITTYTSDLTNTDWTEGICAGGANPTIASVTDSPDPVSRGSSVSFDFDWADGDTEPIKAKLCSTNSLTNQLCDAITYATSSVFTYDDPETLTYSTKESDGTTLTWWGFVCDDSGACSAGTSGNTTITNIGSSGIKLRSGTWKINYDDIINLFFVGLAIPAVVGIKRKKKVK